MFGVTKSDRIRNVYMKENIGVMDVRENRLEQFGHVKRRNNNKIIKKVGEIKVERKRGRGRSKN